MSLIVGLALGAAALIALANGHGTLGIFAANHLTELVWGAAAALLIVLSQLPRVGAKTKARTGDVERPGTRRQVEPEPRAANRQTPSRRPGPRSRRQRARAQNRSNASRSPPTVLARRLTSLPPGQQAVRTATAAPRPCKRPGPPGRGAPGPRLCQRPSTTSRQPRQPGGSAWLTSTSMKAKAA